MDHSEETILSLLKKQSIVTKSEVYSALKGTPEDDIREAILSLENQKYLVRLSPMGEESYSITKDGLRALNEF